MLQVVRVARLCREICPNLAPLQVVLLPGSSVSRRSVFSTGRTSPLLSPVQDCSHGDTRRSPAAQVDNMAPRREAIQETHSLHRVCGSAPGQHAAHSGRYVGNLVLFTI